MDTELEATKAELNEALKYKEDCMVRHTCIHFSKFYSHDFLKL